MTFVDARCPSMVVKRYKLPCMSTRWLYSASSVRNERSRGQSIHETDEGPMQERLTSEATRRERRLSDGLEAGLRSRWSALSRLSKLGDSRCRLSDREGDAENEAAGSSSLDSRDDDESEDQMLINTPAFGLMTARC